MRPDDIFVLDMLLAAREAVEFVQESSPQAFEQDRMRQLAVIKSIEVIGEAASKISGDFRDAHPELPWPDIVGMRHRLVHGYFEINPSRVWQTVREDLPKLVEALENLVPPEELDTQGDRTCESIIWNSELSLCFFCHRLREFHSSC